MFLLITLVQLEPTIIFRIDYYFTFSYYYDDLHSEEMRQFMVTGLENFIML